MERRDEGEHGLHPAAAAEAAGQGMAGRVPAHPAQRPGNTIRLRQLLVSPGTERRDPEHVPGRYAQRQCGDREHIWLVQEVPAV